VHPSGEAVAQQSQPEPEQQADDRYAHRERARSVSVVSASSKRTGMMVRNAAPSIERSPGLTDRVYAVLCSAFDRFSGSDSLRFTQAASCLRRPGFAVADLAFPRS